MEDKKIKIFIADDHLMFREGIKAVLNSFEFATVIGEAKNGKELLSFLKNAQCDILLLDVSMPIMDGCDAAKIILEKYPEIKVIILTGFENEETLHSMLAAGVKGYIYKNIEPSEFELALKEVINGNIYLSKNFQTLIYSFYIQSRSDSINISSREIEILELVVGHFTTKEIANKLHRAVSTINGHKDNILKKTKCKNITELIKFTQNNNLLKKQG